MKESRAKHRQNKIRARPGLFRQLVRKAEGWARTILSVPGVEVHQLLGQQIFYSHYTLDDVCFFLCSLPYLALYAVYAAYPASSVH